MIKTLIADDESHAIERLRDLLSEFDDFEIVVESQDGTGALEQMVLLEPDVAFLDINMPGISVFKTISSLNNPPLVIFQTAHSKYAADAFDIDALDYLLKPVSRERFARAVSKIREKLGMDPPNKQPQKQEHAPEGKEPKETTESETTDKISVKVQGAIKIIPISDILKISFEEGLSFIYTKKDRFYSDQTLNYYEKKLEEKGFFRSNRGDLINLDYISTIHKAFKGNYYVELSDGSKVELSRRKAQALKKTLDF